MRTLLVMTIAVALAVSFAQATVIAVHDGGTPVASLPGYTGYVVSLVSDTADNPAGFDSTSDPGHGFNGPMNQILAFGSLATATLDFADLIGAPFGLPEQDSHFLLYLADISIAVGPFETSTFLGGGFSYTVRDLNPLPLALIVIADGGSVHLTGIASDVAAAVEWPLDLNIPEPLTLTLLGVGGLALIRRRR